MNFKAWSIDCSFFQIFKYCVLPQVTSYVLAAFGDAEKSLKSKWMSSGIAPMMNCWPICLNWHLNAKLKMKVFLTVLWLVEEPWMIYSHSFSPTFMLKYFCMVNKLRRLTLTEWTVDENMWTWIFIRMCNLYFIFSPTGSGLVGAQLNEGI